MGIYVLVQALLAVLLTLLSVFIGEKKGMAQKGGGYSMKNEEVRSHDFVNFAAIFMWLLAVSAVVAYISA